VASKRSLRRDQINFSWGIYVDVFNRYKDTTRFNNTWLFLLRKFSLKKKGKKNKKARKNKAQRLSLSSLWGRRFCRFVFRSRRTFIRLYRRHGVFKTINKRLIAARLFLKVRFVFFALALRRFTQLFLNVSSNVNMHSSYMFHYKFYANFMKRTRLNFVLKRRRF